MDFSEPMLYTWSSQNTAGHTKKLCTTGLVFVAQCTGNVSPCSPSQSLWILLITVSQIVGPLLYTTEEKPYYRRGLVAK